MISTVPLDIFLQLGENYAHDRFILHNTLLVQVLGQLVESKQVAFEVRGKGQMAKDSGKSEGAVKSDGESDWADGEARDAWEWFVVGRWQQFDGETRVGLLRMVAIFALYAVQLVHFYGLLESPTANDTSLQRQFTLLAAAGTFFSLAVLTCLRQQFFPAWLCYVSCVVDVLLVSIAAALVAGPQSVLVRAYFVVIAASALRMNLRLVWLTTLLSLLGYETLVALADKTWFDAQHQTPIN